MTAQLSTHNPAATLAAEQQATIRLLDLLKTEQSHLIDANIDALNAVTEEKNLVVTTMSDLAARRYAALAATGFDAKETGMQDWLKTASDEGVVALWSGMIATAQAAKEINRTNGLLINKHMVHSQNALNILRGQTGSNNFYGPDGQTKNSVNSRNLVIG
jgi:flagella synthesis protein FlgN